MMEAFQFTDDHPDALPAQWNESVFIIPSRENDCLDNFLSKIPGGLIDISDLNDVDFSSDPCICVYGDLMWMMRTDQDSLKDLDKDPFVFCLKDPHGSCQVSITITGDATKGFPNPSFSRIFVIGAKTLVNEHFETQSKDVPVSLLLDDTTKGCIVLVNRYLYSRCMKKEPSKVVDSLSFVLETTPNERREKKNAKKRRLTEVDEGRPSKSAHCEEEGLNARAPSTNRTASNSPKTSSSRTSTSSKQTNSYIYTQLKNLKPLQKVNIAGVVDYFKTPSQSRGKDYFVSFGLVDPSLPQLPVNVIAFNSNRNKLPDINRKGSVVLLRHVKVDMFNENLQVVSLHFSSYHVFESGSTSPTHSSTNASLSPKEANLVKSLQDWALKNQQLHQVNSQLKKLEVVKVDDVFDMVGMICGVKVLLAGLVGSVTITDGTFPTFDTSTVNADEEEEEDNDDEQNCLPGREYREKYRSLFVTIVVYDNATLKVLCDATPGEFIYLRNIEALPAKDLIDETDDLTEYVQLCIKKGSLTPTAVLPNTDRDVIEVKESLETYMNPEMPSYYSVVDAVTFHEITDMPFSTVNEVVTTDIIPQTHRLDVHSISIHETCVEDIVKLFCNQCLATYELPMTQTEKESGKFLDAGDLCVLEDCKKMEKPCVLSYLMCFTLTITDGTGELDVTALGDDAMLLMPNVKVGNLYLEPESREMALFNFETLFGYDPFDEKPDGAVRSRIDCGIFSFYQDGTPLLQEQRAKATVLFRMFKTILCFDNTTYLSDSKDDESCTEDSD